jgi:hypothetical protein
MTVGARVKLRLPMFKGRGGLAVGVDPLRSSASGEQPEDI